MSTPDGRRSTQPQPRPQDGALPGYSKLDVAGYILALVLPPFGLVVGVVLAKAPERRARRHGIWIIAISLVVGVLFVLALIASAHVLGSTETE
jgi:hypothetical protein